MKQYSIPTILFVFLVTAVLASCEKEKETFSSSANNGSPSPSLVNNINSGSSLVGDTDQVFYFFKSSTVPISCNSTYCTVRSRYIFQKDSSFALQYDHDGKNEYSNVLQYKGRYKEINNSVSFTWDGWSVAGSWGATGTLRGDTLTVGYNMIMLMSDFEDAVYLRKR